MAAVTDVQAVTLRVEFAQADGTYVPVERTVNRADLSDYYCLNSLITSMRAEVGK